jgi:oligopeptide/dipeptide ABC transporter ATP-binding protein
MARVNMTAPLLQIRKLKTYFSSVRGTVHAVDDVDLTLLPGEALGLVGETGCGKSTIALSAMRLLPPNGKIINGQILLNGDDLVPKTEAEMLKIRWKQIAIIFQGAMNALNPVQKVGDQVAEAITIHGQVSKQEALTNARRLFELVGIDADRIVQYPHEFSGGMKQRVMIAMALACEPEVVIADEPVTALDVMVQAQILELLKRLREELHLSVIMITHDLSVIAEFCDKVAVMYAGKIVEFGSVNSIYEKPQHPYTIGLMKAYPTLGERKTLTSIPGAPPNLINPTVGCRFAPRCPYSTQLCTSQDPPPIMTKYSIALCHYVTP